MEQGEANVLNKAADLIADNLQREFAAQGHHLTGAWEKSLQEKLQMITGGTALEGYAAYYGSILNAGVTADRVPFSGRRGFHEATTSKYIQGLISFWKLRGLSDQDAVSAAFATANKQKKEGMPTADSHAFSSTGQRTGFIGAVDRAINKDVDEIVLTGMDGIVSNKFNETQSETI